MKTNFKRVLSAALAIVMVLSMIPMSFANEEAANVAKRNVPVEGFETAFEALKDIK